MNQVNFPGTNFRENNRSEAICKIRTTDGATVVKSIVKVIISKAEAKFIHKHKHLWIVKDPGASLPEFGFQNPLLSNFVTPLATNEFIHHKLEWKGHTYFVTMGRNYTHVKVKDRFFNITMDGEWSKSGKLPDKIQAKGKGWLKRVMEEMIVELDKMYQPKQ